MPYYALFLMYFLFRPTFSDFFKGFYISFNCVLSIYLFKTYCEVVALFLTCCEGVSPKGLCYYKINKGLKEGSRNSETRLEQRKGSGCG